MDKKKKKIAVASNDGISVNMHFGKANKFYIYEETDDSYIFVQVRKFPSACNGGGHDPSRIKANLEKLSDCTYLLVSKIGAGASQTAEGLGIHPYEIPGRIDESIGKLINFQKVEELIYG